MDNLPTPHKISRMKKNELFKLAEQFPDVQVPTHGRVRELLAEQLIEKVKSGQPPMAAVPVTVKQPGNQQLFDELTQPGDAVPDADTPKETRGGARPGAGRKPGKSNEICKIDNLPTEPNRTIVYALKWIFKLWASAVDCKEIALDADELQEFAVDTTQFLEYHGIIIPQGLAVDTKFVLGSVELIGGRVMIHKAHKARLKKKAEKESKSDGV